MDDLEYTPFDPSKPIEESIKPYVSIIVPSYRPGGLDVTVAGLKTQTFKNFELIFVDMIKAWRSKHVETNFKGLPFDVQYVEPLDNTFPFASYAHVFNTGLVHARGNIVLITGDYLWMPPNCVQKHVDFHKANENCGFIGCHTYLESPALCDLPPWKCDTDFNFTDTPSRGQIKFAYDKNLNIGAYDNVMWSIFKNPITEDPRISYEPSKLYKNSDIKLTLDTGWMGWEHVHFKNESFPLKAALQINGCDEDFSGTHGYQDTEFAERLVKQAGVKWYLDPTCVVHGFSLKDEVLPRLRRLRPAYANRVLIALKRSLDYKIPTPSYDPHTLHLYPDRTCNDWSITNFRNKMMVRL